LIVQQNYFQIRIQLNFEILQQNSFPVCMYILACLDEHTLNNYEILIIFILFMQHVLFYSKNLQHSN